MRIENRTQGNAQKMSRLTELVQQAKQVFIIGNGGSAANAMHMANDLFARGIKAHALTNPAIVMMIANDYGYAEVFAQQVRVYGDPGDLLICLSGSGNSPNILKAIEQANAQGMTTFGIFGYPGGKASKMCQYAEIAGENMQSAEEYQLCVAHDLWKDLK